MERSPQSETPHGLREQAVRCRRLAASTNDTQTATTLKAMACEYDARAKVIECTEGGGEQDRHD